MSDVKSLILNLVRVVCLIVIFRVVLPDNTDLGTTFLFGLALIWLAETSALIVRDRSRW